MKSARETERGFPNESYYYKYFPEAKHLRTNRAKQPTRTHEHKRREGRKKLNVSRRRVFCSLQTKISRYLFRRRRRGRAVPRRIRHRVHRRLI
jgi:hypothetical protein